MKRSVGIVDFTVRTQSAVSFHVDSIHGHRFGVCARNIRLVHIIPELVHIVGALEHIVAEEASPVVLRVRVQEVDPGRVSRPAFPVKWLN